MTEFTEHRTKTGRIFILISGILVISFISDILLGSVKIRIEDVFNSLFNHTGSDIETIILKFRVPKAITALLAGIALSVSGLLMQTLFRNPMAGPDVLGVSSGASLGVAIVLLGFSSDALQLDLHGLGNWLLVAAGWTGAAVVMLLILILSLRIRDIIIILVFGIMVSGGLSAIVSILQYFSNETLLKSYVVWSMGSLGNLSSSQIKVMSIAVAGGILLSIFSIKKLNAMLLGENYAGSIGLNVNASRILIIVCTSIFAGSVTAFCGPIGFIGIAIPHITRKMFNTSDHRILVPGSMITGGSLLILCDIVSQLPGSEKVLPLNSITSIIGIPVVLWILLGNKKKTGSF